MNSFSFVWGDGVFASLSASEFDAECHSFSSAVASFGGGVGRGRCDCYAHGVFVGFCVWSDTPDAECWEFTPASSA